MREAAHSDAVLLRSLLPPNDSGVPAVCWEVVASEETIGDLLSDLSELDGIDRQGVVDAAVARIRLAADIEAEWVKLLEASLAEAGELVRLEHRLKDPHSLVRKLASSALRDAITPLEDLASQINDVLRFTCVSPDELVATAIAAAEAVLVGGDVEVAEVLDIFSDGLRYKGFHVTFLGAEGLPVEVQFHSTTSLRVCDETHDDYEIFRDRTGRSRRERQEAERRMVEASRRIGRPPGLPEAVGDILAQVILPRI